LRAIVPPVDTGGILPWKVAVLKLETELRSRSWSDMPVDIGSAAT
jgi:hypothetical protein